MDSFDQLPDELILVQALEIPLESINQTCRVNRRFNDLICKNEYFWYQRFIKDYGTPRITPTSWKQFYQTYTAVYNPSGTAPEESSYTTPSILNEPLVEFFAHAELGPVVKGRFMIDPETGREILDKKSLRAINQPLNSVLFFTQPTILGQPNPLYRIGTRSMITSLFFLHAHYAKMYHPYTFNIMSASPVLRKYLGDTLVEQNPRLDLSRIDRRDVVHMLRDNIIRELSSEELKEMIPEVTRVYGPLFPHLKVITPEQILRYEYDMINLAEDF